MSDRPDKIQGAPFYRPSEAAGSLLAWIKYANRLEAERDALREVASKIKPLFGCTTADGRSYFIEAVAVDALAALLQESSDE